MRLLSTIISLSLTTLALSANLEIDKLHVVQPDCTRKSKKGDTISVHYSGSLYETGKQFDSSYDRGRPLDFVLGAGRVIKGWDEGLQDMCIGEKRKLTIAPELGYGAQAVGPIPANSILVFEAELMGIHGVKKDEL